MRTVLALLILLAHNIYGQDCFYTIEGKIVDTGTKHPLEYANIYVEELETGTLADSNGHFELKKLCKGSYHLRVSHISCETVNLYVTLKNDTTININLAHHNELLNEVIVHGDEDEKSATLSNTLSSGQIIQQSNKNLSDILEGISGVSTIRNGSGISKPVVHGLFGNRISVINNGIAQAGQRWGNDHAPEIDPNIADHISVVKGVGALQYGSNLGSVVVIEPSNIPKDKHIHGNLNYNFQTNGRGHTLHTKMQKSSKWFDWRLTTTFKRIGDRKTPNYFLTNTGSKENNLAFQADKLVRKNWSLGLYYSLFNTEIGILTGSHVGNNNDLISAFNRSIPFFTNESFSTNIEAPKQQVTHHLLKIHSKYFFDDTRFLEFKYGGQLNQRKEFDRRRNDRSTIAALSLDLYSHFFETIYSSTDIEGRTLKMGWQLNFNKNTNSPETGVLPFIPDYQLINPSFFATIKQQVSEQLFLEVGGRYEYRKLKVAAITTTLPREIERFNHDFHNYSFILGGRFDFFSNLSSNLNIGYVLRSPEVNELYSRGLHQGASRLEFGNDQLNQEKSLKVIWSNRWFLNDELYLELAGYHQNITDYIYIKPSIGEVRTTIRGAFPVFKYQQTNANISGLDLVLKLEPGKHIEWTNKLSIIRGQDTEVDSALVNIPSNNFTSEIAFLFSDKNKVKGTKLAFNGRYVSENRIIDQQDLAPVPSGYFLAGVKLETKIHFKESTLGFTIQSENLFNNVYRDYLNQLRYFADETGRNISFNVNYSF